MIEASKEGAAPPTSPGRQVEVLEGKSEDMTSGAESSKGKDKGSKMSKFRGPIPMPAPLMGVAFVFVAYSMYRLFAVGFSLYDLCLDDPGCKENMHPGWIEGQLYDNGDGQYRAFRGGLPELALTVLIFCIASHIVRRVFGCDSENYKPRIVFYLVASTAFIGYVYGLSLLFAVGLASAFYFVGTQGDSWGSIGGYSIKITLTWVMALSTLWINEFHGQELYRFETFLGSLGAWLDTFPKMSSFPMACNLLLLRLISFNMDLHWAQKPVTRPNTAEVDSYEFRTRENQPITSYTYATFLAYCFYPPTYLAGPTIPFNAWISQVRSPPTSISTTYTTIYGIRWLFVFLLSEVLLHYTPIWAVTYSGAFKVLNGTDTAMFGYYGLQFIWLKFLIIWRFFRLWALIDGIEVVENMNRCVHNNHAVSDFWRSWHRSFNRWLIRYIFVPLGGSKVSSWVRIRNVFVVFTFVAVWHEINWKLLSWGWMFTLFMVPEILGGIFAKTSVASKIRETPWLWTQLCALAAAVNIMMLVSANMVGFSVGLEGMKEVLDHVIFKSHSWFFITLYYYFIAHTQFFVRYLEAKADRSVNY